MMIMIIIVTLPLDPALQVSLGLLEVQALPVDDNKEKKKQFKTIFSKNYNKFKMEKFGDWQSYSVQIKSNQIK